MMVPITWDRGIGSYSTTILYNTSTANTTSSIYDTWATAAPNTNITTYTTNITTATNDWYHSYDNENRTWTLANTNRLWYPSKPKTAQEKLQQIIQARQSPHIHTNRKSITTPADPRETRAHDTLQLLIGPQRYRQYLKNGYVTIHSHQNGKTYQVYPGTKFTHVHDKGKREQDLCIYLAHDFPPTDQLIAKILLIQTDPNHYHHIANKHHPNPATLTPLPASNLTLPEIYKELKRTKAA